MSTQGKDGRHDPDDPRLAWPNDRFIDETTDETIRESDGGELEPGKPRDERERAFMVQQRMVHGLLRAMHHDAESREQRVQRILDRVRVAAGAGVETENTSGTNDWRHGSLLRGRADEASAHGSSARWPSRAWMNLAAAVVLAVGLVVSVVASGRGRLPKAEALPLAATVIEELGDKLSSAVDRRYSIRLETSLVRRPDQAQVVTGELISRGGKRFWLGGRNYNGRSYEIGSNGDEVWLRSGLVRWSGDLDDRPRLSERLGFVLDATQLQIDEVIARLPGNCRVQTTDRLPPAEIGGPTLLRIEGRGLPRLGRGGVESAVLLVDEQTRLVHELTLSVRGPGGEGRLKLWITYHGEAEPDEQRYEKPF